MTAPLAQRAGSALLWQGGQQAAVKGLFLLRLLVLARILDPQAFGLVAIATIGTELLMQLTDFGLIPALIQRARADDRYYDSAWSWGVLRSCAVLLGVVLAAPLLARIFGEPQVVPLIQVIALRPLILALASIRIAELNRELRFRALASITVPAALANTVVAIALAPWIGVWGLVGGMLAGAFVHLVASYLVAPHRPRLVFDRQASRGLLLFGRWIFLTGLIAVAASFILRAVVSRQLGAAELGLYFLATRLAFFPSNLVDEVVGAVAFPLFGRLQEERQAAARSFRALLVGLAVLMLPLCALLFVTAPALAREVLGASWEGTAPLIRVLAVVSAVGLLGDTMVPALNGLGQPQRVTALEALQSSLLIVGVLLLVPSLGALGAALAWLPAVACAQIVGAVMLTAVLPRPFANLAPSLAAIALASVVSAVTAAVLLPAVGGLGGLLLAVAAAAAATALVLWQSERRWSLGLSAGLVRAFPQLGSLVGRLEGGPSAPGRTGPG